jgi:tripartite-type tricarboxylate transporter receptor subunit TctC
MLTNFRSLLFTLLALAAAGAHAQQVWPSKPIRWLVPFSPGGPADVVARVVAQGLAERVGRPNIVENRPGAAGNVAHDVAAKAAPDGYTLLFVVPSIITNPFYFKASVDPFKELASVIHLDNASLVLVASPKFSAANVADVVARIKANPGKVSCGSSGALPSVSCEMLRAHAGVDMLMVQYKGNAPALTALMGGEIDLMFDVVNIAASHIKSGRVRGIASTAPRRGIGPLGELPVMDETIPGFELATWHGVMAPAGMARELRTRINQELNAVLQSPTVRERLLTSGLEIAGGSPEEFDDILRRDFEKYGKVLRAAGVNPE